MNVKIFMKVLLISCSLIFLNSAAMNLESIKSSIHAKLSKPIDCQSAYDLANEIKIISQRDTQRAEILIDQAYMLISIQGDEEKYAIAQVFLQNLEDVPALDNKIKTLEADLADKIPEAAVPMPKKPRISESEQ